MAGDISRQANGRWKARVRTGGRGSPRLSRTFDRKADAEVWVTEMRRRRQLGRLAEDERGTLLLSQFVEVWWSMHVVPNLEVATRQNYAHSWTAHIKPTLGNLELRDISPKAINRWKAELLGRGTGAASVRLSMVLLGSILNFAILEEELDHTR